MYFNFKHFILSLCIYLSAFVFFSGCTDISSRENVLPESSLPETAAAEYTPENQENHNSDDNGLETYSTYTFSGEDEEFIGRLVFVGDSICMGLSSYGILPLSQVIAQGSVAARNIMDYKFKHDGADGEFDVLTALVNAASNYIVLSMGMNDLNITDEDIFCENYTKLISMIKTYCPDSEIIVLSITPVCGYSEFTDNTIIDRYNSALKTTVGELNDKSVYYLDIGPELKNSAGELKNKYTSGDGLHFTETAYYAILRQICDIGLHLS